MMEAGRPPAGMGAGGGRSADRHEGGAALRVGSLRPGRELGKGSGAGKGVCPSGHAPSPERVYENGCGVRRAAASGLGVRLRRPCTPGLRLRRPWDLMFNAFGVEAIRPQRGRRSEPRVAGGAPWVREVARQNHLLVLQQARTVTTASTCQEANITPQTSTNPALPRQTLVT
jgi:hypothetical protein